MRPTTPRSSWAWRIAGLAALAALAACSQNDSVPICENCEAWDQLTSGLARFPAPHPTNPKVFVFSTIEKRPGAPDANRDSDEDIWLSWVVDESAPSANPIWQLTGDEVGISGDNFAPRWSPDGNEIAFVHTSGGGEFEIWRLAVALPAGPTDSPVLGTPERVTDGRDVAWASGSRLIYTLDDKLFAVDVAAPAPRGAGAPLQLSFDPPTFAASDEYVDRHPDFTADGEGIFDSVGRENVANVYLKAFEVDNSISPPETLETNAWIFFRPPGGIGAYPIFEGADTLRTPTLLRAIPVGAGAVFDIGVRLDGRFLADTSRETYCDTTITRAVDLQPSDSDTLQYYFEIARGSLRVQTPLSNTTVSWTRDDGLTGDTELLANAGDSRIWNCLLSYPVAGGVPNPGPDAADGYGVNREDYLVTATRPGSPPFEAIVTIQPGDTTDVLVYPPEPAADPARFEVVAPVSFETSVPGRSSPPAAEGRELASLLAARGGSAIWRAEMTSAEAANFAEIVNARGLSHVSDIDSLAVLQNPAISPEMGAGVRYLAFIVNEAERWALFVQRVAIDREGGAETWKPDGSPVRVETPGTSDNLDCARRVFYPRFLPGSSPGNLLLLVAMSSCPDNGFGDIGFDEDPWAIGELKVWQVTLRFQ